MAGQITGLYNQDGKMVFDKDEIHETVLDHFTGAFKGQRTPPFINKAAQDSHIEEDVSSGSMPIETTAYEESQFEEKICAPYSLSELDEILDSLANGKAAGKICCSKRAGISALYINL